MEITKSYASELIFLNNIFRKIQMIFDFENQILTLAQQFLAI